MSPTQHITELVPSGAGRLAVAMMVMMVMIAAPGTHGTTSVIWLENAHHKDRTGRDGAEKRIKKIDPGAMVSLEEFSMSDVLLVIRQAHQRIRYV